MAWFVNGQYHQPSLLRDWPAQKWYLYLSILTNYFKCLISHRSFSRYHNNSPMHHSIWSFVDEEKLSITLGILLTTPDGIFFAFWNWSKLRGEYGFHENAFFHFRKKHKFSKNRAIFAKFSFSKDRAKLNVQHGASKFWFSQKCPFSGNFLKKFSLIFAKTFVKINFHKFWRKYETNRFVETLAGENKVSILLLGRLY